ncbi:MAG: endolytic transglycosylase MltG [Thermoleophilaceae bacterium]
MAGSGTGEVRLTIPRGSSVGQIADALASRGVVSSAFFFQARATIEGRRADLKSGTYVLRRDMSYSAALDALVKGPAPNVVTVTIPEGRSRAEIERALGPGKLKGDYLTATRHSPALDPATYGAKAATSLEGFLFPNTYQLKRGDSTTALVTKQLEAFRRRFATLDLSVARRAGLSAYDVVVIASLIEREAELDSERPTIASVIYNRLRTNMPLGIDATTRFATGNWTHPLTSSELAIRSPYNTRIHPGLPPGPIGNPGIASLMAAAHPASTQFVYYVANPCRPGTHSFSTTAAQFNADSARYQAARSRSGGHAPSSC